MRLATIFAALLTSGCLGLVVTDHSKDRPAATSTPIAGVSGAAVYVVNGGDHSISVIDPAKNAVVGTIALGGVTFPHHIYLSSDGARMLVAVPNMDLSAGHGGAADANPGAVLLLDSSTGAMIRARTLEMMNHNAIYSPDGSEVWTSQMMMPGTVLVLDARTLETKQAIDVGDMPAEVTFSRDGTMAFVANGMSNDVSIIDTTTKTIMTTVSVGKGPVGPWPGVDGIMYTDCEEGKSISAIDPTTMAVVRSYALGFMPGMVATPPNGGGELWVTNADDGKVVFNETAADMKTGEVTVGAGAHGIAFSADGKTAYVTNQGANTVSVIDVAARTVSATIAVGSKPNGIAYRAQ